MQNCAKFKQIDAVNQGHWSLSIQWRLECFVIVEKYKQFDKAPTYSQNDSKIEGCLRCQLVSWKRARKWLSIFNLTFIYTHFSESNLVLKLCRRYQSPKMNLEKFLVRELPETIYYIPEIVSESEETLLIDRISKTPRTKWTQLRNRRLQNWGGMPTAKGMIPEAMPSWLDVWRSLLWVIRLENTL